MSKQERIPGKIAVIYARYSSHNQRDVSIEQQVNACRKYAKDHDLDVIRVYDDHAMTGTNDNRPQFQRMIRDSASGAFDYVIVYTLDRFSRDRYDSAIHKHTLKENGVKVLSAMENIQDNPTGVLMESVLEGFAEYYSKELAQKIRRGIMNNAEKCMVIGPLPLGYKKGADGRFEIIPEEAQIVQEIFERVSNGEAFVNIFRDLNGRGVTTKRGLPWDRNSLSKLIHSEKYIGVYQYSDLRIENGIPPIIDKDLFDRVQERCRTKPHARGNPQKRRRENSVYLLTGKLYCGECKGPMVGISGTGSHGELHFYYTCKNRRTKKIACSKKQVTRDYAEELVASELIQVLRQQKVIEWIADSAIEYLKEHQETDEIVMLKERLDSISKEKDNTLKAIRQGIFHPSVQQMLEELTTEESSLKAKLSIAQDRIKNDIDRSDVIALMETFADGDVKDKSFQELLFDAFLVRAYLYDDKIKVVFTYTGKGTDEVEVPFDADDVEDKAIGSIDVSEPMEDAVGSSYSGIQPPCPSSIGMPRFRPRPTCGRFSFIPIPPDTKEALPWRSTTRRSTRNSTCPRTSRPSSKSRP